MNKIGPLGIILPSSSEIDNYLKEWNTPEKEKNIKYAPQEKSLTKLFTKTYPLNQDLDDILIKVSSINEFYSTNILSPFKVAKHIHSLNIDEKIKQGDLSIVNEIALVKMNEKKPIDFYSFATKYCSHHKPETYPIYDYYVVKMLLYLKKHDKTFDQYNSFNERDLRHYEQYKKIILKFQESYCLEHYDLKQIDKYLWMCGKDYFPKKYKKKIIQE